MFQSTFVMGPICSHCYAVGWEVNDFHLEQDLAIKFNLWYCVFECVGYSIN